MNISGFRYLLMIGWMSLAGILPGADVFAGTQESTGSTRQKTFDSGHEIAYGEFDRATALAISQGAISDTLSDVRLQDADGKWVDLTDLRGKPLIISLIYTSCHHICPTTTAHLDKAITKASQALGRENFEVVSIGFDSLRDNPDMMRQFSRNQGITDDNWKFLSGDQTTIRSLAQQLGFIFYPSPHGFDHLIQTTLLDREHRIVRQLYGMKFSLPQLIDPLKVIVFDEPTQGLIQEVTSEFLLFCTVYDPTSDRYKVDYSIFIGMFIGLLCVGLLGMQLFKEWRITLSDKPSGRGES